MPVHTGYDNNKKQEPKCYARWGKTGKKYYYTCNNEEARDKAKGKAATQGRAIIAGGWREKNIDKEGGKLMPEIKKNRNKDESIENKQDFMRNSLQIVYPNFWLICTFDDAIIANDDTGAGTYEILYSIDEDGNINFGEPKEVTETYIEKRLFSGSFNFNDINKLKETAKGIESIIDTWESWAGSYTECVKHLSGKPGISNPEALCAWLHFQAEGKWPGEKSKEKESGLELTGPIFKKVEKKRIVYAAVLVPGEPDLDADKGEKILTAEEIEGVAHKWMEEYGNIDYMHGLNNVAKPVETFMLPMEWEVEAYGKKMLLPKGTWILAAKVMNDKAWKEVEEGKLTGFSIMGIQNNVLKRIMGNISKGERVDKELNSAMKRVLIRDLGKGWIVPFVSLIDEACVPKSKFFAIKEKDKSINKNGGGVWEKIMSIFKKEEINKLKDTSEELKKEVEKAGRSISADTYTKLKNALAALQAVIEKADKERKPDYLKNKKEKGDESEMEKEEVQKMINESLDEKLKPIDEGLKALLPEKEEDKKEKEDVEKKKEEETKKVEEEEKAKKEKEEAEEKKDKEEKEALKTENLSLKETLEKLKEAKKGLSKAEKGQEDGEKEDKPYSTKDHLKGLDRDSQGRAIKKKE